MRVRVLHAKLYAYALPGSTARQLFISSTLLDSSTATRQTSTDLDRTRRPGAWSQARQARQELDSNSTGSTGKASTAPRQCLDGASTARQLDSQGSSAAGALSSVTAEPPSSCGCRSPSVSAPTTSRAENPCKCSDVLLNSLSREGRSLTAASHSSDSARRAYTLILPNTASPVWIGIWVSYR